MTTIAYGAQIPLFVILESGANDNVIKASIVDPLTGADLQSNLVLTYVAGSAGRYRYTGTLTMPDMQSILIEYKVYQSDGTTLIKKDSESIELAPEGGGGGSAETLIGIIQDDQSVIAIIDDDPLVGVVNTEE